ncbi:hypothetical protein CCACVL1_09357 [Corchorus capsularis]|uniref:Uncharacterized protein n=1 Tax=Corchorus capsularis TaxID=210143 RepID=A0A1R3IWN1_COCAP|nr:hypothetical protein CCACVL1_09357 [Corchorus capsularis]
MADILHEGGYGGVFSAKNTENGGVLGR